MKFKSWPTLLIPCCTGSRLPLPGSASLRRTPPHELRTPVAVISACAEELQKDLPGEAVEPVAAIQRESARMHKILSQLLLLTRGYEGRYHLEREVFPLREVVASVMEELAETASASQIRLFNQVLEEVSLYADQSLTTQPLINLIGNSIRYGRERG